MDAISERRWKMVGLTLKHPEKLHNIILKGLTEEKKTATRPQNSYVGQMKSNARAKKTSKNLNKRRTIDQNGELVL